MCVWQFIAGTDVENGGGHKDRGIARMSATSCGSSMSTDGSL